MKSAAQLLQTSHDASAIVDSLPEAVPHATQQGESRDVTPQAGEWPLGDSSTILPPGSVQFSSNGNSTAAAAALAEAPPPPAPEAEAAPGTEGEAAGNQSPEKPSLQPGNALTSPGDEAAGRAATPKSDGDGVPALSGSATVKSPSK